jgi:hypothetical protein
VIRFRASRRGASDESGFALVVALGSLVVLAIVAASLVQYTGAGSRDASRSSAGVNAYSLAEAGINNAVSVISISGTNAANLKPQPQYAGDPNSTVSTFTGGDTATWGASYDASIKTWTIKSIGSTRNPTGSLAPNITRTLRATVDLVAPPPYSFVSLNSACDQHSLIVRASGQLTVTNAMYVNSCNSPQDAFDIFGPGGSISAPDIRVVGGWETHNSDIVVMGGVTCPLPHSSAPLTATAPAGCPITAQPVIADPFLGYLTGPTLGTPACTASLYGSPVSYNPHQTVSGNLPGTITATQTTVMFSGTAIQTGDVIQIENEQMLVLAGGGTLTLTLQRGQNGTTAASHASGKEAKKVPFTGTTGTAALPSACQVSSGTVTLQPGTYYGGVCIGVASGNDCGSNIGGSCTTSGTTANVTMAPGTYIMAGGGFFVCGASTLSAPNVLIYDTQDPSNTAGSGAIDQIEVNTTGSVSLGPQTSGAYQGLTMFEDPALGVASNVTCASKTNYNTAPSQTQINEYDIALVSMASTGANGALGSISGTIYAPAYRAMFADRVSGTANLAVLSSCILIDGGDSTFNFQQSGLYGVGARVEQYG